MKVHKNKSIQKVVVKMSGVRVYGEKSEKSRGGAILLSLTVV